MTRFLAVLRRIFLGGVVSLILCLILLGENGKVMIDLVMTHNSMASYFSIFFLLSPLIYLVLVFISAAYIRKNGQFAEVHQSQSPVTTFFRCIGSDLISPFKCIRNFFVALFSKNVMGRGIIIWRFIGTVVLCIINIAGIGSLLP